MYKFIQKISFNHFVLFRENFLHEHATKFQTNRNLSANFDSTAMFTQCSKVPRAPVNKSPWPPHLLALHSASQDIASVLESFKLHYTYDIIQATILLWPSEIVSYWPLRTMVKFPSFRQSFNTSSLDWSDGSSLNFKIHFPSRKKYSARSLLTTLW